MKTNEARIVESLSVELFGFNIKHLLTFSSVKDYITDNIGQIVTDDNSVGVKIPLYVEDSGVVYIAVYDCHFEDYNYNSTISDNLQIALACELTKAAEPIKRKLDRALDNSNTYRQANNRGIVQGAIAACIGCGLVAYAVCKR